MNQTITITAEQSDKRIDALASELVPDVSRSQWQKYGKFLLKGKEKKSKTKVTEGQEWELQYDAPSIFDGKLEPWDFPLKVLKETDDYVVIKKPVRISIHPSPSEPIQKTVVNALVHQFGTKALSENSEEVDGKKIPRPGIVHRLDKPTSGVLLVAKNNVAHKHFTDNWEKVEKIYYAMVTGTPPEKGNIEGEILRDPKNRKKMTVMKSDKARDARTSFEVVNSGIGLGEGNGNGTLLKVQIFTGRTHQIRVHLSSIGYSIVGDELYGGIPYKRLMLHAHALTFPDPSTGEMVTVESGLPAEFEAKTK